MDTRLPQNEPGHIADALEELAELRACVADVASLHAQYLAECEDVDDSAYEDCDDATLEARHHAQTCALAHALWILKHSRQERAEIRREVFNRAGLDPQDEPAVDPNEPVDVETLNVVRGFAGLDPLAVDPVAEIEERGAVLRIDWDTSRIVWAMDSDGMREPIATHMSDGSARLVHLRAAAARLLERIRGAK